MIAVGVQTVGTSSGMGIVSELSGDSLCYRIRNQQVATQSAIVVGYKGGSASRIGCSYVGYLSLGAGNPIGNLLLVYLLVNIILNLYLRMLILCSLVM